MPDSRAVAALPRKRRLIMLARTLRSAFGRATAKTRPALSAANLPHPRGRLEIVRDRRGIPHVYAEVEEDLFSALGWLQAADRFVLLDLVRHLGAGRLCALVGNLAVPRRQELFGGRRVADLDAFVRPLGFEREAARDAARLAAPARAALEAFAEGANAALAATRGVYASEYLLLGRVRPWSVEDCLLVQRASGFVVSVVNLENELCFDAVRAQVGDDVARRLYPDAPWDGVPTTYAAPGTPPPEPAFHLPAAGSNNWAIAGSRSASGAPILANDPHVPLLPLPTYWYHAHLEGPRYRVQGGVFPGCPIFGFGHNGFMAWGCTTGFRDAWDLVRIHRLQDDPSRYHTPDGSASIGRHRETLPARFGRKVELEWESCEHGVVYPGWRHHDGVDLALRLVPADLAAYVEGYLDLPAAETVEAHRDALARMNEGPFDFNHVYAHREGTIAWELFGRLPRRPRDGLFARDAHDPDAQWEGFVPFADMPKRIDPACGFVASANSVVDPEDFERIASLAHFEPRIRQQRIEAFLGASSDHDAESFGALQADTGSDYGAPLRDALLPRLRRFASDPAAIGEAYRLLAAWDGNFPADAGAPALFSLAQKELATRCFEPLLGRATGRRFANGRRGQPRLYRLLLDPADPLREDVERACGRPLDDLACEAFEAAVGRVRCICGDDPASWRWGRIQRARLGTILAEIPGLGGRFLALDAPFPGEEYTVSPSRPLDEGQRLRAFIGASSRFVCDLGSPDEAWFAHTAGPSGDAGSSYYASCSEAWLRFEYFRCALWPASEVPDPAERLVLEPGADLSSN
jgi:penicillin amidase